MAGAQSSSQDSATLNTLPSWYTNYSTAITNAGLGALQSSVYGYRGAVDQTGQPLPRVAGLAPQQQQAQAQVNANQGNWLPGLNTGVDMSNTAFDVVSGAGNTFNQSLGQTGVAGNTYGQAIGTINGASPDFSQAGGLINSATGNFGAGEGMVGSATPNFNQAGNTIDSAAGNFNSGEGMIGQATGSFNQAGNTIGSATNNFGQANSGFNQAGGVINNNAIPTINMGSGYLNSMGGALSQAQGMLNPAMNTAIGGSQTLLDPGAQAQRDAWMNPYTGRVANEIARLSNQNLFDNVIPDINSTFVGSGQFGSTRDGKFMNDAIQNNQQTISGAQAQMLLQAQNQADSQYASEKARQLAGAQAMGGLSQVGANIGNAWGNAANANTSMGNALTSAGQALTSNAAGQTALGNAVVNQGSALTDLGNSRVNQGSAMASIGDKRVNQGNAQTNLGLARVTQGNTMAGIGDKRVNQGNAMTNLGLGRVQQGSALTSAANGQGNLASIIGNIGNSQVGMGNVLNNIGLTQAQLAEMRQSMGINDINALLTSGGLEQLTNQRGLDATLADFYDRRDFPLQTLGGLSQLLPNVSGRVMPDTQASAVAGIPNNNDPYKNVQDIINIINGVGR